MDASSGDREIVELIESASGAAKSGATVLASSLLSRCWPGGTSDRTETSALAWVRQWGPRAAGATPPACSCAQGRCAVCN